MNEARWLKGAGRVLVSGALVVTSLALWLFAGSVMRLLSVVAIFVFAFCAIRFANGRGHRPFVISGMVVAALLLSPLEVSPITRTGLPGIVRLVMGLPGPALRERARRGEVVLGGCVTTGLEPRWVVVW
jgi:hypothetical protein